MRKKMLEKKLPAGLHLEGIELLTEPFSTYNWAGQDTIYRDLLDWNKINTVVGRGEYIS